MDSGKGSFHWVRSRRLGLDDEAWWLGATRFMDYLGVIFFCMSARIRLLELYCL